MSLTLLHPPASACLLLLLFPPPPLPASHHPSSNPPSLHPSLTRLRPLHPHCRSWDGGSLTPLSAPLSRTSTLQQPFAYTPGGSGPLLRPPSTSPLLEPPSPSAAPALPAGLDQHLLAVTNLTLLVRSAARAQPQSAEAHMPFGADAPTFQLLNALQSAIVALTSTVVMWGPTSVKC